ncbi:hypothetical protein O6H91_Y580800 [Diphasiastrum complanatum]|nr:hypothetical protein O6H91_Y580800 [Diphasiastrum complanatum]
MRHSVRFLSKLCEEGKVAGAVAAVEQMHKQGHQLSAYVFYCLLKGCTRKKDLATGRRVRCLIVNSKYGTKTLLGNHLIHMFSSGGSLLEALHEFRRFAEADVHMWSAIISAHAKHGKASRQSICIMKCAAVLM